MPYIGYNQLNNIEHNDDPNPKHMILRDIIVALYFVLFHHNNKFLGLMTYAIPCDNPQHTPHPKYIKNMFLMLSPYVVNKNPNINKNVDNNAENFICLSTIFPKNAAPNPNNKIFKQNVN